MAHQMPFMSISGETCSALGVSSPPGLKRNVTLSPLRFDSRRSLHNQPPAVDMQQRQ